MCSEQAEIKPNKLDIGNNRTESNQKEGVHVNSITGVDPDTALFNTKNKSTEEESL